MKLQHWLVGPKKNRIFLITFFPKRSRSLLFFILLGVCDIVLVTLSTKARTDGNNHLVKQKKKGLLCFFGSSSFIYERQKRKMKCVSKWKVADIVCF